MVNQTTNQGIATRIANGLFSTMEWLIPTPAEATPQERRAYRIAAIGFPLALLFHVLFIFLFSYWGVLEMALFNIGSVAAWTVAIILARRMHINLAYAIAGLELLIHQILVVYFVGWGMGMQYYLISLAVVAVLSAWPFWIRVGFAILCTSIFIVLYFYALENSPIAIVDPAQLNLAYSIITALAILMLAAMMFYGVETADRLEMALEREHEKSETLLNNILPEAVSARLKSGGGTIADYCEGASILFADVVDFTPMSAVMSATELVELLNEVFSDFDALTEQYGLEKIKTIGDCYMVASGVPQPRSDHAQVLMEMALEMQERVNNHEYNGHKLAFRIGINSGPVVAGVIGRQKFAYDLWGDAVNTASRMESHGTSGCIQITRATYDLIKDDFICEPQGSVTIKGKGELDIWHVTQEKTLWNPQPY